MSSCSLGAAPLYSSSKRIILDTDLIPSELGLSFLFLTDLGPATWISLGSIILLLACSALLSGSEVAFFSITHNDIEELQKQAVNKGGPRGRILRLLEKPHYLLSTILISNNFVNIGIILTSNFLFAQLLPESTPAWLSFLVTVVLVTFLLVLFGEVAPKVYATSNNMRLSKLMAQPLLILRRLFWPLSWVLVNATRIIERRLAKHSGMNVVTDKDIEQAIELTVGDTKYAEQDIDILKGIVKFGNTTVKNIMCARVDVEAVDSSINFSELLAVLQNSNYSRIPVYEETFDKVLGIVHTKDLIEHFDKDDSFDWHSLIRPAFFIPENKKIDDLFNEFQHRRTHMAIVVDEYGGSSGIVTLEDVLEEIVGEINDEFDEPESQGYTKISEHIYIFEAKTSIQEACKIMDIEPELFEEARSSAETLAGLLLMIHGSMPKKNSQLLFQGIKFQVLSTTKRRIETIKVTLAESAGEQVLA